MKKAKVSKYGQWKYPGQDTIIPNANGSITMKGVSYPVLGIDDQGNQQMMMPGGEYQFPGNSVYEIPMMAAGGIVNPCPPGKVPDGKGNCVDDLTTPPIPSSSLYSYYMEQLAKIKANPNLTNPDALIGQMIKAKRSGSCQSGECWEDEPEPVKVEVQSGPKQHYTIKDSGNPGHSYLWKYTDDGNSGYNQALIGSVFNRDFLNDEQQIQFDAPGGGTAVVNYDPNIQKVYSDQRDVWQTIEDERGVKQNAQNNLNRAQQQIEQEKAARELWEKQQREKQNKRIAPPKDVAIPPGGFAMGGAKKVKIKSLPKAQTQGPIEGKITPAMVNQTRDELDYIMNEDALIKADEERIQKERLDAAKMWEDYIPEPPNIKKGKTLFGRDYQIVEVDAIPDESGFRKPGEKTKVKTIYYKNGNVAKQEIYNNERGEDEITWHDKDGNVTAEATGRGGYRTFSNGYFQADNNIGYENMKRRNDEIENISPKNKLDGFLKRAKLNLENMSREGSQPGDSYNTVWPDWENDRFNYTREKNPDVRKSRGKFEYGGVPRAQDGMEMPFGLPLKEQNIYTLPEYNQPKNPMTGEILPDPRRPNLGMGTGATEYKYTYGTDEGDIDIPSIVAGQYIGDQALDRYNLTGERFKTMTDPGSYSKFYEQIGRLGLMQEKQGGTIKQVKIKSLPKAQTMGAFSDWRNMLDYKNAAEPKKNLVGDVRKATRPTAVAESTNVPTQKLPDNYRELQQQKIAQDAYDALPEELKRRDTLTADTRSDAEKFARRALTAVTSPMETIAAVNKGYDIPSGYMGMHNAYEGYGVGSPMTSVVDMTAGLPAFIGNAAYRQGEQIVDDPLNYAYTMSPLGLLDSETRGQALGNYLDLAMVIPTARMAAGPLVKNAYKINPWAGKLGPYNRVVGSDAIADLRASGLVRSGEGAVTTMDGIPVSRPTAFPSFAKGAPRETYINGVMARGDTPYIISTNRPMGVSTLGRHGKGSTQFPIGKDGKYLTSFPASEASVYKAGTPHWLNGYKQVIPESRMTVGPLIKNVGEFLTTQTPLRNAYKYNPWAFKPDADAAYRMIGNEAGGYADAIHSGVFRPNPTRSYQATFYNAGAPYERYGSMAASGQGPQFIAKVPLSNPKLQPRFEDDVFRVTRDNHVGIREPGVQIFKENWLQGYKPVKIGTPQNTPKPFYPGVENFKFTTNLKQGGSKKKQPGFQVLTDANGKYVFVKT